MKSFTFQLVGYSDDGRALLKKLSSQSFNSLVIFLAKLKINVENTEIVSQATEHNHPPNPKENSVRRIRHNMKTLVLSTEARSRQIISETLRDSTPELPAIISDP
ncbi:hypothetical protein RF11_13195 [Thelohanellus kitauei]|uniref:Uncharacterized protein n=1 Tax=Thelohanellus kitauei TaxID=669202 RepID=A0A0C2J1K0_THEKT|nr:hypothetical protein RF11_13195 [Thelohanellus kitauei]